MMIKKSNSLLSPWTISGMIGGIVLGSFIGSFTLGIILGTAMGMISWKAAQPLRPNNRLQ